MKHKLIFLLISAFFLYVLASIFIFTYFSSSTSEDLPAVVTRNFLDSENLMMNQSQSKTDEAAFGSMDSVYGNLSIPLKTGETKEKYYCLQRKPNFTQTEYNFYWKYKNYSPCKTTTKDLITVKENDVDAVCADGNPAKYFYDPGEPENLFSVKRIRVEWKSSKQDIGKSQFVLIKCGANSVYTRVFFSFNEEVARNSMKIKNSIDPKAKPFTVAVLVFDSLSEMSAEKNLPKSWNFLNDLKTFNTYKFPFAKANPFTTRENVIPITYGMHLADQEQTIQGANLKNVNSYQKYIDSQQRAIWREYSKSGYITFFGYDSAFDFLARSLGAKVLTDHKFINFYKLTQSVYRFTDMTENQRCAGDQGGHKPMLDATLKYYKTYQGYLRFGYTHISSAHENTGNIRTVDNDLLSFLQSFVEYYKSISEDFVLFVMGDHGRMNNLLRFDARGYWDTLNPLLHVVTSKAVDGKALTGNLDKLIGRFDLHLSLRDLVYWPYGGVDQLKYLEWKNEYKARDVVSLFREEIKYSRTCEDMGSDARKCFCDTYKQVDFGDKMYEDIVNGIIAQVNKYIYEMSEDTAECEKPEVKAIVSATHYEIRDMSDALESVYIISYKTQYSITIKVEAYFWYEKKDKFLTTFATDSSRPWRTFNLNQKTANILIWDLSVGGPCGSSNCLCKSSK